MKDLHIPPDPHGRTPLIDFKLSGEMVIEGRSNLENVIEHYQPAIEWINDRLTNGCPKELKLTIKLEYFNTRSSKMLLTLLKSLETIHLRGKSKINVTWLYSKDDADMLEAGNDYQSVVKLPFNIALLSAN